MRRPPRAKGARLLRFLPRLRIGEREGLRALFEGIKIYETTTHFNGQSTVAWGKGSASGVLNCIVHLVKANGPNRSLTIASVRYLDEYVKLDGLWYFKQREAVQDWSGSRPLTCA